MPTQKSLYLNSINTQYAYFQGQAKVNFDISKDTFILDFALSVKEFINQNKNLINNINFQNLKDRGEVFIAKYICEQLQIPYTINRVEEKRKIPTRIMSK